MEEKSQESFFQHLNSYVETRWNLFILKTSDKISDIVTSIISSLLILLLMVFVLLFLSVSAAIWIGQSYGDLSIGFFFVGLFYLLIAIVIYLLRKTFIKLPVINKLLNAFYSDEKN